MQDPGKNLDAIHQARPGPAEEGVAVHHPELRAVGRCELVDPSNLLKAALEPKAAGHDDDDLRLSADKIPGVDPPRAPARGSQQLLTARQLDQPGRPVAAVVERIDPFQANRPPGPKLADALPDQPDPAGQLIDQARRPAGLVRELADGSDVLVHVIEALRLQG